MCFGIADMTRYVQLLSIEVAGQKLAIYMELQRSYNTQKAIWETLMVVLKLELRSNWALDHRKINLTPGPFPPPVFDHLQYANTERLGDQVTAVSYV